MSKQLEEVVVSVKCVGDGLLTLCKREVKRRERGRDEVVSAAPLGLTI